MSALPEAWPDTYGEEAKPRMGFFTDTSICIGCKACEVACKEWNLIPEDGLVWTGESYDNTSTLGANSWRHVAFIEQNKPLKVDGGGETAELDAEPLRWLMSSDVCKHCTHAGCLDVCPTGSLFRTEFGGVFIDYFLKLKRNEAGRFQRWLDETGMKDAGEETTDWEQREYFELF